MTRRTRTILVYAAYASILLAWAQNILSKYPFHR